MQATAGSSPLPPPPASPAPAAPSALSPVTITFTDIDGTTQTLAIPMTAEAVRSLRAQREELSSQLRSAANRRHSLSRELRSAPSDASRAGLEQRMAVLDKRIVQLESDIAATGRQLSAAAPALAATTEVPNMGRDIPENVLALSVTFIIFVLFPIAFSMARYVWKRTSRPPAAVAQLPAQTDQRLERLEQGVEAIAVEIERVTEGQRFVTRLLSEQSQKERLPVSSGS